MPVNIEDAMKAVELLSKDKNMQLCVEESVKGALWAGAGAFLGGIIAGPVGMAAGAAAGGLTGAKKAKTYKPVIQVFREMNEQERKKLFEHVKKVIRQLKIEDGAILIALASNTTASGHDQLQKQILSYFGNVQPSS